MTDNYRTTGESDVMRRLNKAIASIPRALAASLYAEGLEADAEMVKRIPVEYGVLRGSHYVSPPTGTIMPRVQVGVGTKYAAAVHERTEVTHDVGQAKYLSSVVDERRTGYAQRVGDRAWKYYEQGVGVDAIPETSPKTPHVKATKRKSRRRKRAR
jgi:hypothetical protein